MKRLFLIVMISLATMFVAEAMEQQPLYIVDGKVVSVEELKAIPSEDIESVTTISSEEQLRKFEHFGDTSNGVVVVSSRSREYEGLPFAFADIMPSFMGGDIRTFQNWIMENLRYPDEALNSGLEETIIIQFVVNREGYIASEDVKALKCDNEIFLNEAKRVITLSPRWTPAIQNGFTVPVSMALPIQFEIYKETAEPTVAEHTEVAENLIVVRAFFDAKQDVPADKQPLYMVDGAPVTLEYVQAIPPQKIKYMHILKEGADYYEEFGDTSNGVILINLKSDDPRVEDDPDTLPEFLGGSFTTFEEWVVQNTHYPYRLTKERSDLWAHLLVKYIINTSGYVEVVEITTMKGTPSRYFDEEIRATMLKSPRWTPAMKDGSPVAYQASMPILFGKSVEESVKEGK